MRLAYHQQGSLWLPVERDKLPTQSIDLSRCPPHLGPGPGRSTAARHRTPTDRSGDSLPHGQAVLARIGPVQDTGEPHLPGHVYRPEGTSSGASLSPGSHLRQNRTQAEERRGADTHPWPRVGAGGLSGAVPAGTGASCSEQGSGWEDGPHLSIAGTGALRAVWAPDARKVPFLQGSHLSSVCVQWHREPLRCCPVWCRIPTWP